MDDSNSLIIRNAKAVVDMQWNPFVASQIAIALESSDVKVWNVPSDRSVESLEDADLTYPGKSYCYRYAATEHCTDSYFANYIVTLISQRFIA